MNKITGFLLCGIMCMLLSACGAQPAQNTKSEPPVPAKTQTAVKAMTDKRLIHSTQDDKAPLVLFTKDASAAGLLRIYEALGRKPEGKVGIKISFETPGGPHLDPAMLKPLRDKVNGTFIDSNGFSAPRHNTEGHIKTAVDNGFTKEIGPIDILDAEGEMNLPVQGGKHLKFHRTGSHFANYDSVISIVRFKVHHLRDYGGTLKNLSICLASTSGKANIHSGGKELGRFYEPDMESFLQSVGEAAKAAQDAKKDRWVFINVLAGMDQKDSCEGASAIPDIGIVASLDPVAVDQAAIDFAFGTAKTEKIREAWEKKHQTRVTIYAEEAGAGKRNYRIESID